MANEKAHIDPNLLGYAVLGVVGYFGVAKPLLEKLGILDNADVRANKSAEINEAAWNPTFHQLAPAGSLLITDRAAADFSYTIHDSFGVIADNYNAVMGIFQRLKTKSQVSYLADKFQQKYNTGLYQFLNNGGGLLWWDGLSSAHLATINKYVSSLPNYTL